MRRCRCPAVLAVLFLVGCSDASVLLPAGPIAEANRAILLDSLAIMLAIVLPTMAAIIGAAWWFRSGNARARYRPEFVFSGRIELVVWGIPLLVILFLGGVIWIGSHRLDPFEPVGGTAAPLEVEVIALDWKWLFLLPAQGIASVDRLVVPVGTPVHFRITSASVFNVFFVPRLGSQVYAMNGMTSQLWLRADRAGSYYGRSAHFSGDGFARMSFRVEAVPPGAFAGWVAQARRGGGNLDRAGYVRLARPGEAPAPFAIAHFDPGLFDAVVRRQIAATSGAPAKPAGAD